MYVIVDWDKNFENNRTRNRCRLNWVPFPNSHDGSGYAELLDHKDGPAHYGAWCAIVQVASRCSPRGKLVRSNGQSHDSTSLSRVIKFPAKVIDEAIRRCIEIGWMSVESDREIESLAEPQQQQEESPKASIQLESIPVMTFVCTSQQEWHLTLEKLSEYELAFPAVDVMQECRTARQWCIDNPSRRKTVRGMPGFLSRWLARKQNQGGRSFSKTADPRGTMAAGADFLKSRGVEDGQV